MDRPNTFTQQGPQPLQADRLGVVQVNHQGLDRATEWRAWLKPGRCWRGGALAAAGAASTEQPHPRHVGPHRRQLDAVVDHLRRLRRVRPSRGAVRAGVELGIGDAVRVRLQRPGHAGAAFARRLAAARHVRLLTF